VSVIHEADFIESIAEALQFISCYHSSDFINALVRAYQRERSPQARDAMAQILLNSRMCAEGRRPICQDTGIVNVFLKVGIDVQWQTKRAISELVNDGVRRAYTDSNNPLRASVVDDPEFSRRNTGDNTPAITHIDLVPGAEVEVTIGAKGGGSENKARFTVLLPSEPVGDWIIETVSSLGAGWCPPGILGIGIGGTAEKAMLLAKESLFDEIDIDEIFARVSTCMSGLTN
jgi:fumarate hydratase class I